MRTMGRIFIGPEWERSREAQNNQGSMTLMGGQISNTKPDGIYTLVRMFLLTSGDGRMIVVRICSTPTAFRYGRQGSCYSASTTVPCLCSVGSAAMPVPHYGRQQYQLKNSLMGQQHRYCRTAEKPCENGERTLLARQR